MMKIAIAILLASAFSLAQAQDAGTPLSGKWKIHSSIAGNDSDATCTFTPAGSDLVGTCPSPDGDAKLTGKLDGKKITWSYQVQYNGSPVTLKYEGTLEAGKITGTVTVDPFGVSGDFAATPTADSAAPAKSATVAPAASTPAAASVSGASISGKWKIHNSIAGNENDSTCTFAQTGNDLTGTCPSADGDVKLTGKIDGKKIAWSYPTQYNGSQLTMKYDGTVEAGKITGSVTVDPFGVSGDFSAAPIN